MKLSTIINWILRLLAALVMLQALFLKFTAHAQSVQLFTHFGMEPWGRFGVAVCPVSMIGTGAQGC